MSSPKNAPVFQDRQPLQQLPARRGGYFYLPVSAATVALFSRQQKTRLQCVLDNSLTLSCGLNPIGDGSYFIIVASRHLKTLKKKAGDEVFFQLTEDPNPLGVSLPEVLEALLEQDEDLRDVYNHMTDGKKRSLIFSLSATKGIDRQVQKAVQFLTDVKHKRSPYRRSNGGE